MKILDVKNIKTARKYANALLESAKEKNIADEVEDNLVLITQTINMNEELKNLLFSPIIKINDKKEVLGKVFYSHINKETLEFLYLLSDNNRLNIIFEVLECYIKALNSEKNIVKPIITSAVELDESQKNRIKEKLSNKLSKIIIPEYKTDNDIIGGIIIEIEDKTIDCSLRTKFENMRKQLTKGNKYGSD